VTGGSTPALIGRTIVALRYVGDDAAVIEGYSLDTGQQLWRVRHSSDIGGAQPCGGVAICVYGRGGVFALDPATGAELWRTNTSPGGIRGEVVTDGLPSGRFMLRSYPESLSLIDARSGRTVRTLTGRSAIQAGSDHMIVFGGDPGGGESARTLDASLLNLTTGQSAPVGAVTIWTGHCAASDAYLACRTGANTVQIWQIPQLPQLAQPAPSPSG
jgi:outer membrane protein assembly factor BamB